MTPGPYSWVRACRLVELDADELAQVDCDGRRVAVSLVDGEPVAVRDRCPHRDIALSGGRVRDGAVTCPGHFWRFDLRTGRAIFGREPVPRYDCRVEDGWVVVHLPPRPPELSVREMLLAAARAPVSPQAPPERGTRPATG